MMLRTMLLRARPMLHSMMAVRTASSYVRMAPSALCLGHAHRTFSSCARSQAAPRSAAPLGRAHHCSPLSLPATPRSSPFHSSVHRHSAARSTSACSTLIGPAVMGSILSTRVARYAVSRETVGAQLLPVVNKLQEVLAPMGTSLDLPQLVVIGGQSSGKSSVLENLVGRDFLPRGAGICTRRPLILQLVPSARGKPYGEFSHLPDRRFDDFSEIRREIERETERIAGRGKSVSEQPIILRITSPDVLPLTLVDTPGMTRVAVGDQPSNIEHQIRSMVDKYVRSKNSIILAVHPANQDIATSDALKVAKEVDPRGMRTIGVLTKLDLMDSGTNALNLLLGRTLPLKLGFVGVVNRSQKDIESAKSISEALKAENKFFESNHVYAPVAHQSGTRYLATRCNQLLSEHIRNALPEVQTNVRQRIKQIQEELEQLGEEISCDGSDQKWIMLQLMNSFAVRFREAIEGTKADIGATALHGGARIRFIFDDVYRRKLDGISTDNTFTMEQYRLAIRNAAGPRPSLFVPTGAFEVLVKKQIQVLREPSLQCAELILAELQRICANLNIPELSRFPKLHDKVVEVAGRVLAKGLKPAQKMISDIIDCELAYINTNHPDFVGNTQGTLLAEGIESEAKHARQTTTQTSAGFFSRIFGRSNTGQGTRDSSDKLELDDEMHMHETVSSREKMQIQLIKRVLASYFDIARKSVQDSTTKAIWHFLVNKGADEIHRALVTEIYTADHTGDVLSESPGVTQHREQLKKELKALHEAAAVLGDVEWPAV